MIRRAINIGRWDIEFYFAQDSYDIDLLLDRMYTFGASASVMKKALSLMEKDTPNTGFTFTNPEEHLAIVAIGPTTSGREFQNTIVHELYHLAAAIAAELGVKLHTETPAYIAGDSMLALAEVMCALGCEHCNGEADR